MDPHRFDAFVQSLAALTSRRRVLAGLAGLLPVYGVVAERKTRGQRNDRDRRHGKDQNREKKRAKGSHKKHRQRRRKRVRAEAAAGCCAGGNCSPGQGKNLTRCCFEGQDLTGKSFKGSNLTEAHFTGATLTNAKFQGSNLTRACLVDATITGANFKSANLSGVIRCRTITSTGEDNSGCDRGTPCCPTCDAVNHPCPQGQVCCDGRCVEAESCGGGCPTGWIELNGFCAFPCDADAECQALGNGCTSCASTPGGPRVCLGPVRAVGCGSGLTCEPDEICTAQACRPLCQPPSA